MIQERIEIEARYVTPITSGTTITVSLASSQLGTSIDCRRFPFLRFGMFFDKSTQLILSGSLDNSTFFTFLTFSLAASTYATAYSLPTPQGQDGHLVLSWPYFRCQIKNTDAAVSTVQQFYLALTNYRS